MFMSWQAFVCVCIAWFGTMMLAYHEGVMDTEERYERNDNARRIYDWRKHGQ